MARPPDEAKLRFISMIPVARRISFYAVLDIGVGLAGRLDLTVWGLTVLSGLWWSRHRISLRQR